MTSQEKKPRFQQLKMEDLDDRQRPIAEEIMKVSSVGIGGPYNSLLRSPMLAGCMINLLDYLRFNTTVPRRLNEFAILIQSRIWTSQVEWYAHYPIAIKAGLSESVAAELNRGIRPGSMRPDEAAVYDYCMELTTNHVVSDATFQNLREFFSEQQLIDLTAVTGTYVTLAMLMNAVEQGVPLGATAPLKPLPK